MLDRILGLFSRDIGIDLGTANTLVHVRDRGIVMSEPSVQWIVDTVKDTIEETPPELVADIMDQGIVLAGGGALLAGLDRRVAEATQMPVHIADDPLTCVARGTGVVLQGLDKMSRVLVSETYSRPPR